VNLDVKAPFDNLEEVIKVKLAIPECKEVENELG
jgi:hypothetical protein